MSFVHGKNTEAWYGGRDISPYFNAMGFAAAVDAAESTTFRKTWKTYVVGAAQATVEGSGYYDPLFTDLMDVIGSVTDGVLTVGMGGLHTQGDLAFLLPVIETNLKESSPVGDLVSFDFSAVTDGVAGNGVLIAPLAAVSADQNGATYDGLAATTTGAIAHLHVTSVSSADSIVVTVQDASVPSGGGANWATIGTFASKSAIGAERLVIAGTIRRYLRVVDDVTGSSVSIIRGVAVART